MYNKIILIGNVGRDPIIRHTVDGIPVGNFRLAVNEITRDSEGNTIRLTEWFNIVVWRNLADIAEKYIRKGMLVFVEGRLRTRTYVDAGNNQRTAIEVIADNIRLLSKKDDMLVEGSTIVSPPETSDDYDIQNLSSSFNDNKDNVTTIENINKYINTDTQEDTDDLPF